MPDLKMFHLHAAAGVDSECSVRSIYWVGEGLQPKGARKSFSIATLMTKLLSHPTVSKNDRPFSAAGSRFTIHWRWI